MESTHTPAVSVIVPNYNHAPFLRQRIDSILNQTFQDLELIILDDCSTDDSRRIIESYRNEPRVRAIIYNEANSGSTFAQWKRGLREARGKYVWIAESDDYADADFLSVLVSTLENHPEAAVAFTGSVMRPLRNSGLIISRREGKEVYYRAADTPQSQLLHKMIEQVMEIACPK